MLRSVWLELTVPRQVGVAFGLPFLVARYNEPIRCDVMDARKREQNERKFGTWRELPDGGRQYWHEVKGRSTWRARYVKEVDAEESTIRFYQEVYDGDGTLREDQKYPVDLGHQQVTGEEP